MHNCQNIKQELLDLLFGEANAALTARLQRELRFCGVCRTEYAAMQKTFAEYEKFSALDAPEEKYWQAYETTLNRKLMSVETAEPKKSFASNFCRKFLAAQIRVPVPVAAAFAVLLACATFFAVRLYVDSPQTTEIVAEPLIAPVEKEKIVVREKEVWRERVVTQKIYVPQRESKIRNSAQAALKAQQNREFQPAEAKIPTLNLAEFAPPSKVEPRIVAEGKYDDK